MRHAGTDHLAGPTLLHGRLPVPLSAAAPMGQCYIKSLRRKQDLQICIERGDLQRAIAKTSY